MNPEDRIRRIRELCAMAAAAEDPDEVQEIASQLRAELHAQIAYLKDLVAQRRSRMSSDGESDESDFA
jgi:hypothetical protein